MAFRKNGIAQLALQSALGTMCYALALPSQPLMLVGALGTGAQVDSRPWMEMDCDEGSLSARPEVFSAVKVFRHLSSLTSL